MKKLVLFPLLCMFLFLGACASSQDPSPIAGPGGQKVINLPPMSADVAQDMDIVVQVENKTTMREGLKDTVLVLMQSEYGAREAQNAESADYIIKIRLDKFGPAGTESESASAGDVVLPGLSGAALGAQIGSSFDGNGTLIGLGVGLVAGIAFGSAMGAEEYDVWGLSGTITVVEPQKKEHSAPFELRERGRDMALDQAASSLENALGWAVVRSFKKD